MKRFSLPVRCAMYAGLAVFFFFSRQTLGAWGIETDSYDDGSVSDRHGNGKDDHRNVPLLAGPYRTSHERPDSRPIDPDPNPANRSSRTRPPGKSGIGCRRGFFKPKRSSRKGGFWRTSRRDVRRNAQCNRIPANQIPRSFQTVHGLTQVTLAKGDFA